VRGVTAARVSRVSEYAAYLKPAGLENSKDIITAAYLKDPTDPQWENAPDFIEWKAWMAKYMPSANLGDVNFVYAYSVSFLMHQTLKNCGDSTGLATMRRSSARKATNGRSW